MLKRDMSVSLDEVLKYLLKKWKFLVVCALLGGGIATVTAKVMDNSIVIPQSENYVELKEQEAEFLDYINNSIRMKMDPLNVPERTLFIDNISDRNTIKDYIDSGEIWRASEQTIPITYLTELTSWGDNRTVKSLELKVQHYDEEECGQFAEYLARQIKAFDSTVDVTVGVQRTVIDKSLGERQLWYLNRLQDIQGQLEYTAQGCIIEVSETVAIAFGTLLGGICAVTLAFFLFLLKREL